MTKYVINGGKPLHGEVEISGAKNAAKTSTAIMIKPVVKPEFFLQNRSFSFAPDKNLWLKAVLTVNSVVSFMSQTSLSLAYTWV